jgi:hypothetical protein
MAKFAICPEISVSTIPKQGIPKYKDSFVG